MMAAMESVSSGKVTVTAASREFNVPRKTIDDRVKEKVTHGKKPGVNTVLTTQEEESQAKHLIYMAECGFPLTRTMVKAFGWAISKAQVKLTSLIQTVVQVITAGNCSRDVIVFLYFVKQILLSVHVLKLSTPKL